jgi:hypothetical protein
MLSRGRVYERHLDREHHLSRNAHFATTLALVLLIGVAVVPPRALAASSAGSGAIRAAALAPRIPPSATRLGRLPPAQPLTIAVVLEPSHRAELDALLEAQYNPTSPSYEQWLSPAAFMQLFGPSPEQIDAATNWLHQRGLSDTTVDGFSVRASAASQSIADALGITFSSYALADGKTGYSASSAPLVPANLAAGITSIVGLSDTVRFENRLMLPPDPSRGESARAVPRAQTNAVAAPRACQAARDHAGAQYWTPDQVGRIYGVDGLVANGMSGQGRTIGLLELAPSRPTDNQRFLSCFGLHNQLDVRKIDGGGSIDSFGTLEANIDIQEAAISAPGASIRSYEAPNTGLGEYDAYNHMVHDNVAAISTSWGFCESALEAGAPGFIGALHTLFQRAAAQGQSVFAASGDKGSEDCYDSGDASPDTSLQVDSPANDPFVTGVGGTSLGAPGVEPVWNDCEGETGTNCAQTGGGGTGGGQSAHFHRPRWQPVAADSTCTTCRGVPDVAANAGVGETFYDSDFGGYVAVGGTSIGAPRLAGIVADISSGCARRVGDFAPRLAMLASKHVYGTALTDITRGFDAHGATPKLISPGDNDVTRTNARKFKAAGGFDLATGFGVPIARGLSCPQVMSLSPRRGRTGTHVTVRGLGLEQATITFGAKVARVLSRTATTAVVEVPAGKGSVNVSGSDPIGSGRRHALFGYPDADTGAYRLAVDDGAIFTFGGARFFGSASGRTTAPVVGIAIDHATGGYWLASSDGNVYNFNAPYLGSTRGLHLNQPIVGVAATATGDGYWLVARDGGIFAFGGARFYGSTGGMHLNQPIVGIAGDERTGGYWLVASDGGIFAFHAPFHGSTGAMHLNRPIVGMVENPSSGGYWLVASDGGVFSFRAPFYGSTGALRLNQPIVGMTATGNAHGYWFVASDGGVFTFGNARFAGSMGGTALSRPIVAITTAH